MLTIELEPELENRLIKLAEQQHLSVNEIVRQFIKNCLQQKQLENKRQHALKRLESLRGKMIVGDVISPLDDVWTGDANHL